MDSIFCKNFLENKEIVFKNGVKNMQAAGKNVVHMEDSVRPKPLFWYIYRNPNWPILSG